MNDHKIEIENWKYEFVDYMKNPPIFVIDKTKKKYNVMDVVEILNKDTNESHKRIIMTVLTKDIGMKNNHVLLLLGEKADFDRCIISAVLNSTGQITKINTL